MLQFMTDIACNSAWISALGNIQETFFQGHFENLNKSMRVLKTNWETMREKGYCMDKSQREDNIFGDGCVGSNCMDMTVAWPIT